MNDALMLIVAVLALAACVMLGLLLVRKPAAPVVDVSAILAGLSNLDALQQRLERTMGEQLATARHESAGSGKALREELATATQQFGVSASGSIAALGKQMQQQLALFGQQLKGLSDSLDQRLATLRGAVDAQLKQIQIDNNQQLEKMRATVDEKLQSTLERRLSESFKQVSERLEAVQRGLGEMQSLSTGVTDLKRVMSNVKTRGTWGEWQLEALLEQMLTPSQYQKNYKPRDKGEVVEFAIRLPGQDDGESVYLPIDSKFPVEDYQRLVAAADAGDADGVAAAGSALEARIKTFAREIRDKYIVPPKTTNYGVLFLPTESLYAEVLRRPGLAEGLQNDCRVTICGPTTLAALINSLQMGFRTMAIQKRSGEVFKLLGAVKGQFDQFGELLGQVQRKLDEASEKIGQASKKSDQISKRLRDVEALPIAEAKALLPEVTVLDESDAGQTPVNSPPVITRRPAGELFTGS